MCPHKRSSLTPIYPSELILEAIAFSDSSLPQNPPDQPALPAVRYVQTPSTPALDTNSVSLLMPVFPPGLRGPRSQWPLPSRVCRAAGMAQEGTSDPRRSYSSPLPRASATSVTLPRLPSWRSRLSSHLSRKTFTLSTFGENLCQESTRCSHVGVCTCAQYTRTCAHACPFLHR